MKLLLVEIVVKTSLRISFTHINSLAPGRFELTISLIISKLILVIDGWDFCPEISFRWMSLELTNDT